MVDVEIHMTVLTLKDGWVMVWEFHLVRFDKLCDLSRRFTWHIFRLNLPMLILLAFLIVLTILKVEGSRLTIMSTLVTDGYFLGHDMDFAAGDLQREALFIAQ